jgi:hypothetical protein
MLNLADIVDCSGLLQPFSGEGTINLLQKLCSFLARRLIINRKRLVWKDFETGTGRDSGFTELRAS